MGNFEEARKFNGVSNLVILLEGEIRAYSDPPNLSAAHRERAHESSSSVSWTTHRQGCSTRSVPSLSLNAPYTHMISTEGYIGMALVGGAAAVGTLLIAGLIRRAARK